MQAWRLKRQGFSQIAAWSMAHGGAWRMAHGGAWHGDREGRHAMRRHARSLFQQLVRSPALSALTKERQDITLWSSKTT